MHANKIETHFECRRYPPQVFVVFTEARGYWPSVRHSEYCGEFEPKEPGK